MSFIEVNNLELTLWFIFLLFWTEPKSRLGRDSGSKGLGIASGLLIAAELLIDPRSEGVSLAYISTAEEAFPDADFASLITLSERLSNLSREL